MFGHSASLHEAGALPNSLSPETAKGTRGDDLIVAPLARSLMVNIAHLRKLNEAYTGRPHVLLIADRRGRRHRPGCGFIVGGCGRPRNSGALSGPRRGGLSANAWRPARPAFVRIAWNLPSLHDFVHRENAKPSNTYSRVGACQRG
jgi:hypothetical protein